MSSNFYISSADIFESVDANNRRRLAEYGRGNFTSEQVLYLMNQAPMDAMKQGVNFTVSAAQASLLIQQLQGNVD